MTRYGRHVLVLLRKDLTSELRGREIVPSLVVFALLVLLIFAFSFDLRVENLIVVTPGLFWVTFAFTGVLSLERTAVLESTNNTWEGLVLTVMDRGAIYLAKVLSNFVFIALAEAVVLPALGILGNVSLFTPSILLTVLLATLGFAIVGTLLNVIASKTRASEVLLPVLLLPILVPVLIGAVNVTSQELAGSGSLPWLNLLIVFDVVLFTVSYLAFEALLED